MMRKEIEISIVVLIYNQERFIRKALDSILAQKNVCSYEVILGDDASTDRTREILEEYIHRYPDVMKPAFQQRNGGIKNNLMTCLKRCCGKYVAVLEGDDYWSDDEKLRKQIEWLDQNPEYVAVGHHYDICSEKGDIINGEYEAESEYTLEDYKEFRLPAQSSALVCRNMMEALEKQYGKIIKRVHFMPTDRLAPLLLLSYGRIYRMPETMSVHRKHIEEKGTNWSSIHKMKHNPNYLYRYMILWEMERLLKWLGLSEDRRTYLEYRTEMYFKSRRAIAREEQKAWMWIQGTIMLLLEPCRKEMLHLSRQMRTKEKV